MTRIIYEMCLVVCAVFVGFVAGRYSSWNMEKATKYVVVNPSPQRAVNKLSCGTGSLHDALEVLRVCRARARSSETQ